MKVTGANITDWQIRSSGADDDDIEYAQSVDPNWPGGSRYWSRMHRRARARCADAWNARNGDSK